MKEILAKRIKNIRQENNLTQSQFGEKLSVSQDNVSLWENGKSLPTAEQIINICKLFNVTADYLLGLTEY
ncbi:MAG: helix-turn-helix transcriptional regulator [Clostridia bacterium]|jgi:transcriptional regulator with XRE-family HTH domain|nr:helix-turn-helix transcriptional regulator [Clostridia bacterium]